MAELGWGPGSAVSGELFAGKLGIWKLGGAIGEDSPGVACLLPVFVDETGGIMGEALEGTFGELVGNGVVVLRIRPYRE